MFSQKLRDKLCDIYRWKTSLSPTYLSDINNCEIFLNRWAEMRNRMRNIFILLEEKELLNDDEKGTYETFKNLVKPEYWEEVKNRIRNKMRIKNYEYIDIIYLRN